MDIEILDPTWVLGGLYVVCKRELVVHRANSSTNHSTLKEAEAGATRRSDGSSSIGAGHLGSLLSTPV